jgi:hypothetical protein
MNRRPSESIKRIGFRKWYERQLLSSHAHFALAFLSAIALTGSIEAYRGTFGDEAAMYVMFVLACAAIGAWALRRYSLLMVRAEEAANQASCPDCGEYGRFTVVRQGANDPGMEVRCRKCSREWAIFDT